MVLHPRLPPIAGKLVMAGGLWAIVFVVLMFDETDDNVNKGGGGKDEGDV